MFFKKKKKEPEICLAFFDENDEEGRALQKATEEAKSAIQNLYYEVDLLSEEINRNAPTLMGATEGVTMFLGEITDLVKELRESYQKCRL